MLAPGQLVDRSAAVGRLPRWLGVGPRAATALRLDVAAEEEGGGRKEGSGIQERRRERQREEKHTRNQQKQRGATGLFVRRGGAALSSCRRKA